MRHDPFRRITGSLFLAIVFVPWAALAQTSWKGTVNNNWSTAGNWTNSGAYTTGGGNTAVAFGGTTQSLNGTTTFRKLIINAGSTAVLNANVTVTSQLIVSGALDPN